MARRKTLRVPTEGPCAGHPCDGCERCLAGDCCGGDVGEAGLPLEGSWPHEHHGTVGVLEERKGLLRCHCCGGWYENLGRHIRAHDISADAYRAMWGLNSTRSLVGPRLAAIRAEMGRQYGHRLTDGEALLPSAEQRSKWASNREARAETRLRRGEQPRSADGVWVPASEGRYRARLSPRRRGG